ncbi:hypothetical protein [Tropicimonas aquimaris]|uniref:Uncharacterized protein n=1 Tax=Tropicimonas aquimaris TaxID=914152 RepID=A0ABW3IL64_9RHOB
MGIFDRFGKLSALVNEGEQIEIHRPIFPEAELLNASREVKGA